MLPTIGVSDGWEIVLRDRSFGLDSGTTYLPSDSAASVPRPHLRPFILIGFLLFQFGQHSLSAAPRTCQGPKIHTSRSILRA